MPGEALKTTAHKLVEHCRVHTEGDGLRELYDPGAVSVEAMASPGAPSPVTEGVEGIRDKHAWWQENFEVHDATTEGPFLHGEDRFAVIFEMDATNRQSGERSRMREVGIYTVDPEGKIVREEFYYGE